ncbi:hypothetical protein EVJ30_12160 [Exiguobacterium sp. SH5S13]|uniref:hypothetical protein n=1 Tax=unclassified Exiguobacterium TaxID=2644629 RepID=UPI00103B5B43|nr:MULTISPECIES: hypothetical protein [unclassified Exiguobacterium]TCI24400.1 hypothetical protein EVJ32_14310 [Exiguobacterium sp. SH5S4]TCI50816.1 hypothetical protein EVJ30_12160 [Exiguobacterium sp. SH5S13]
MKQSVKWMLLSAVLLSGCGKDETSALKLDYIDHHWTVNKYSLEAEPVTDIDETLAACTGDLTTSLDGELTVFDTVVASRPPLTNSGEDYMFKSVTYVKGDKSYAICRDMVSHRLQAEVIPSFPEEISASTGTSIGRAPAVLQTKASDGAMFLQSEVKSGYDHELELFPDSLFSFSQALYGEMEIAVEGWPTLFPINTFEPATSSMGDVQMMMAFSPEEKLPYVLMGHQNGSFSSQPIEVTFDATEAAPRYESLKIERIPLTEQVLESGKSYPIFTFTYMKDGAPITDTVTITYREETFITEEERDLQQEHTDMQSMWQSDEPFVYLHKKPFSHEQPLAYPDVLKAAGTDMTDLIDTIDAAESVNRSGDAGEYHQLTILDGLKGQEFEVTYKQRSKKIDIFLTDKLTGETYKLTSEGAETFLSYFPDLKKTPKN